jgi:hypothetical protein
VWLRAYGPEQSWFDETWRPSEIEEVKSANGHDWPDLEICSIAAHQPQLAAWDVDAGFGAIATGIGVAMLYPHVQSTPLTTASLAGRRRGEAKSEEPQKDRDLVFSGRSGRSNLDNFKSGRTQYARDLQPCVFISRLDGVQDRIGPRFFHRIVFVRS